MLISKKRTINVTLRDGATLKSPTSVTLNAITPLTPAEGRLDELIDVNATNEIDGASLVYDANSDVYIVKKLDFDEIEGELDGGTF